MDPVWLLLLLPAAAASGWFAANRGSGFGRKRNASQLPSAYFRGLNFLINEQPDKAIELFLKVLEVDTETVEMHLAVGNLFRRRGEIERATRIHQNLVARPNLDKHQRAQALYELGQDYFKAGLFDRAEQLFAELADNSEYEQQARKYLLQIFDQEKEWDSAIAVANTLAQKFNEDTSTVSAQYCCELAEVAITEGRYDQAQQHVAAALKADRDCVRATIQAGRLHALHGDHKKAVMAWRTIENQNHAYVGEVVDLISNSYRALDDLEGLQDFLRLALQKHRDVKLMLALTETMDSRSGGDKAERFLVDWLRRYPTLHGLYRLIQLKLRHTKGPAKTDLKLLEGMIGGIVGKESSYECKQCGFTGLSLHWQCPGCKGWNTSAPKQALSIVPPLSELPKTDSILDKPVEKIS
ncbi:MAG: lipopolysaccharide assembly protein LapB [Gammaproteobacteria bacterium]|nr:lipopolysaccharide assembly protein LapB [Gammaproteobacteria bacterium]